MEFTRTSIARELGRNAHNKDRLVSILHQVGAAGEQQAIAGGYADLIAKGLTREEPEVVCATCAALSNMGGAGAAFIQQIASLVGAPQPPIRAAALEALGRFEYEAKDYAPRAAGLAASDSSDAVKAAAIRMLGSVGADDESALIKSNLDASDVLASAACEALGKLGMMRDSGEVLGKMVRKPSTCFSALTTLADMGNEAPVEALDAVITVGLAKEDIGLRELASSIVGNLSEAAAREPYLGKLKSALGNSSAGARAGAATAFGYMGVSATAQADAVVKLLSDDVEETSGPHAAQVIGTTAKRSSPYFRLPKAAALWALGQMKATQHIKQIGECANDKNWEVRLTALDAVAAMGPAAKAIAEQVAAQLTDPAFPVRASAAHALGQMGADEQAEALVQALTDSSHSVRLSALLALAELREAAADYSHDVFKLVQDPMVPVQAAAVRCLAAMGDTGCNYAGVLATLLNNQDPELRAEVCDALGRMGDFGASFAEDVSECLYDKNTVVSEAAMRSLSAMGPAGRACLVSAGFLAASEPGKPASLPAPTAASKGYVSALERERAKLGI